MTKKLISISTIILGIMLLHITTVCASEMFHSPAYINPFGGYELRAEFDDYEYSVLHDGTLYRFNKATQKSEKLASEVSSFITDNEVVYYTSYNEENTGIYKLDTSSKNESKVFDGQANSVESCWQNKYLYFYVYDENNVDSEFSTWFLNLENGQKQMIIPNSTKTLQVCNDKLFYSLYSGDNTKTDIYISDLDGNNSHILIPSICDFEIFDNQIYYAKCDKDYGIGTADFHMIRCDLNGENPISISGYFNNTCLHRIDKNSFFVLRDHHVDEFDYNLIIDKSSLETTIKKEIIELGYEQYAIISAYKGTQLIWEFTTPYVPLTELESISEIVVGKNNVYIVANSILYALDINNGQTKWTADDIGAGNCITLDGYENVYVSGYYGPNLVVFNNSGKLLYKDDDQNYGWVHDLKIVGNVLNIYYSMNESGEVDGINILEISQFYPDNISVSINNQLITFDQPPILINDRTLVPLRAIFEALGAVVDWNEETQTVTATNNNNKIFLTIGSDILLINGKTKMLDVPAQLVGGRTLVPVRAISEAFQCQVEWNQSLRRVIITTNSMESYNSPINRDLLMCIGKTKEEIVLKYNDINSSEYYLGGKYYIHGTLKTQMLYDKTDGYDSKVNDDLSPDNRCTAIYAHVSELFPSLSKQNFSINELQNFFGEYQLINDLDNDIMGPSCSYTFHYDGYSLFIESDHLNPQVEYIYISKNE